MGRRGNKVCPQCNGDNGPRSFNCKHCGYAFKVKKGINLKGKAKLETDTDWRSLNRGDIFKVFGHCGPFYTNSDGERTFLGYKGRFRVVSLDENGINAVGVGLKSKGAVYVYMGSPSQSRLNPSITLDKHKIERV